MEYSKIRTFLSSGPVNSDWRPVTIRPRSCAGRSLCRSLLLSITQLDRRLQRPVGLGRVAVTSFLHRTCRISSSVRDFWRLTRPLRASMTRCVDWSITGCLLVLPCLFFKTVDPLLVIFFSCDGTCCRSSHRAMLHVGVPGQEFDTVLELSFST